MDRLNTIELLIHTVFLERYLCELCNKLKCNRRDRLFFQCLFGWTSFQISQLQIQFIVGSKIRWPPIIITLRAWSIWCCSGISSTVYLAKDPTVDMDSQRMKFTWTLIMKPGSYFFSIGSQSFTCLSVFSTALRKEE
jgi:hypothetical protein